MTTGVVARQQWLYCRDGLSGFRDEKNLHHYSMHRNAVWHVAKAMSSRPTAPSCRAEFDGARRLILRPNDAWARWLYSTACLVLVGVQSPPYGHSGAPVGRPRVYTVTSRLKPNTTSNKNTKKGSSQSISNTVQRPPKTTLAVQY